MTNFEKIKQMTAEELSDFFAKFDMDMYCHEDENGKCPDEKHCCRECVLAWLTSPAGDGERGMSRRAVSTILFNSDMKDN